jgi:hypothetical protein
LKLFHQVLKYKTIIYKHNIILTFNSRQLRNSSTLIYIMVKEYKCPVVNVPDNTRYSKHSNDKRGDMGWGETAKRFNPTNPTNNKQKTINIIGGDDSDNNSFYEEKKEFQQMFASVKDLTATSFTGMSKKTHKEDKLTKLGALPVKQQKMPLKMKLGIIAGREKRLEKTVNRAKEEGVVLPTSVIAQLSKKSNVSDNNKDYGYEMTKKQKRERPDLDIKTYGGVFHLSKDRLPSRLTQGKGGSGRGSMGGNRDRGGFKQTNGRGGGGGGGGGRGGGRGGGGRGGGKGRGR